MKQVLKRVQARLDISQQARRIADDNPDAARRFVEAVERTLELLCDLPAVGVARPYRHSALQGLRVHPVRGFGNHLIFYRPIEDGIELVRVLHGARDIEGIFADEG